MHHLVVFSPKISPILTPLLDKNIKVSRVTVLVPKSQQTRFLNFQNVLIRHRKSVNEILIDDDISSIELTKILSKISQIDAANATCDFDYFSALISSHFVSQDIPVYIVDSNDYLRWINQSKEAMDLEDRLSLSSFFLAHGLEFRRKKPNIDIAFRKDFYECVLSQSSNVYDIFKEISQCYIHYNQDISSLELPQVLKEIFLLMKKHGYLKQVETEDQTQIFITKKEIIKFLRSDWLEYYVYDLALDMMKSKQFYIQDVAMGVFFSKIIEDVPINNEMDVVILANNRLSLIECKSIPTNSKVSSSPGAVGNPLDFIYKLKAISTRISDGRTNGALVSLYPIKDQLDYRSKEFGLEIFDGKHDLLDAKHLIERLLC